MSTPKLSTPEMIVRTIQKMIQRGKFKPGQRLPGQRELAEHLNVSRASLREALSTLEALDLVRTSAGRGTYIHDREQSQSEPILDWRFSSQYALQEVYEFRYFTETAAARLAAVQIEDREIAKLKEHHARMARALEDGDVMVSTSYDYEFHRFIMLCSRNRLFLELYDKFQKVFHETQMLPYARDERLVDAVKEHGHIVDAIARHDGDGAAYYLGQHLLNATERIGIRMDHVPGPNPLAGGLLPPR